MDECVDFFPQTLSKFWWFGSFLGPLSIPLFPAFMFFLFFNNFFLFFFLWLLLVSLFTFTYALSYVSDFFFEILLFATFYIHVCVRSNERIKSFYFYNININTMRFMVGKALSTHNITQNRSTWMKLYDMFEMKWNVGIVTATVAAITAAEVTEKKSKAKNALQTHVLRAMLSSFAWNVLHFSSIHPSKHFSTVCVRACKYKYVCVLYMYTTVHMCVSVRLLVWDFYI